MVFIIVAALAVCGGALAWQRQRAVRAVNRLRALTQATTTPTVELHKDEVTQALATLAADDITARRMEASAQQWFPTFDDQRSAEEPMRPISNFIATLRQHSLVLTGLEQALLYAPTLSSSVEHLTLLDYSLMAPSSVEAAASQILLDMAHGTGAQLIKEGAHQVVVDAMAELHSRITDHMGAALAQPMLLAEALNSFALHHEVAGPAIFEVIANHGDAVKIGIEFAENMLHLPEVAGAAALHGVDAIQAAGQVLMENGLTFGQAGVEAWLHQNADVAVGQMHDLIAQHADNAGHALFHGVPLLSGVFLGFQEYKIWERGDADLGTVGKNFMIDFGSRFAGGQIGLGVGAAFGPVGLIVGPIVGAVLFSMLGKHWKEKDLRTAAEQCRTLQGQIESAIRQCANSSIPVVQSTASDARNAYLNSLGSVPLLDTAMPQGGRQAILRLRDDVASAVRSGQQVVNDAFRVSKGGWLSHPFVRVDGAVSQLASQLKAQLDAAQQALPAVAMAQSQPLTALAMLTSIADVPVEQPRQERYWQTWRARLNTVQESMPQYRHSVATWNQNALGAYGQAIATIQPTIEKQMTTYTEAVEPLWNQLQLAVKKYDKEAARLGKKR